jgi:hypothetical protein
MATGMRWHARVFFWGPEMKPEWANPGYLSNLPKRFSTRQDDGKLGVGQYVGLAGDLQNWVNWHEDNPDFVTIHRYGSERLR